MAKNPTETEETLKISNNEEEMDDEDDEEELDRGWEDWNDGDDGGDDGSESEFRCLFCDSHYGSCAELFDHCDSVHHFDFNGIRKAIGLDFYGSFKLINYVRSQVAEHRCWSCGLACKSSQDLQNHLHKTVSLKDVKLLWDDDKYLKPVMQDDSLLYSFGEDEEGEDDLAISVDKEEIMEELKKYEEISIDTEDMPEKHVASASNGHLNIASSAKFSLANRAKDIKDVNENYFGAYSSFGIHREMISDKVRMDAYRQAILRNPSLLNGAVVMDVGCGTGVLSLFAAQAGASRVVAIEASEKMAKVATEIAKNNKVLRSKSPSEGYSNESGVMEVVQSMVEEVEKSIQIQPHSVDVLVSEWMGYCLLYETMLNSVLFARDKWLKPGGAILPDTATIFVAGFGKGGTSLPFWEDVFGFDMSCIGKELVEDAAKNPIVDVVDDRDIVTNSAVLQAFDLVTMKPDEVDFTASVELEPSLESKATWCYGVVLWFETGFTSRFCKEMPAVLSTSPFIPRTHWSQTIFTFREPIAISSKAPEADRSAAVGTEACPAARVQLRISIARAAEYRSIDISLETTGVGQDGRKRSWPVQIFNLQ